MWRNWKDLEKKFKEERFFDVKKGIIDKKGELLVEVDTTKLKGIAPIDAIAIVKIINKNGNELGAYKDLNNTLKLYNKSVLIGLPENSSPVKAGYFKIDKIKKVQLEEEKQGHSCPRCAAPVTVAQLRELFPKAEEDTLKTVAYTYTKYMKELHMDTCWNKAHFFAQAAIETGFKLHIKKGENMDSYTEERLYEVFPSRFFKMERVKDKSSGKKKFVPLVDSNAEFHDEKNRVFKSKELSQKAKQLINSKPKDQNIANFVYANINGNKNEASGDGWRFRGSGLIQLTGRGNFKMVNDKIEKLWGQSILTDSGADQVRENPELAVLTAMGYFAAKGINRIANGASSDQQIKEVCLKVGDDVDIKINNRKTKNHEEKKRFFKDKSSKTFKTNECLWRKGGNGKWYDPVENPQITIFTYSGRNDEANASFGNHRGRPHTGIDIFTPYRTPIYASLNGKIVYKGTMSGYGNTIVIEVDKDELENCRVPYSLQYDKEVLEGNYYSSSEKRYLLYAHLDEFKVGMKDVSAGELIALSGVTGLAENTHGPHLHFEVSSKKIPQRGDAFKYRTNPLNYISLVKSDLEFQKKYRKPTKK